MAIILRSTGRFTRLVFRLLLGVATFALWAMIATAAGWVLLHLPAFWTVHRASVENSLFADMAVSAYALLAGALFLVFACCAVQSLAGAARDIARVTKRMRRARGHAEEPRFATY